MPYEHKRILGMNTKVTDIRTNYQNIAPPCLRDKTQQITTYKSNPLTRNLGINRSASLKNKQNNKVSHFSCTLHLV